MTIRKSAKIKVYKTNAALYDQGFTYNEAGKSYNEAGMAYGGIYNRNPYPAPVIGFVGNAWTAGTISSPTGNTGIPYGPGFFLFITK